MSLISRSSNAGGIGAVGELVVDGIAPVGGVGAVGGLVVDGVVPVGAGGVKAGFLKLCLFLLTIF